MAATDIVDILGVDVRSAPVLMRDCSFPIVDWNRYCPPDEVIANIPIMIGAWEDGTVAPAMTNYTNEVDFTDINADECDVPKLKTTSESCELIAPDMAEVSIGTTELNWKDLRTQFCRQRNILPRQLCVFNSDGSLAEGNPFVIDFVRFATGQLSQYMVVQIANSALTGDDANRNEFDGLYNQLENGWMQPGQQPCGDEYNVANQIPWDVLTGNGGTPTSPDAVTVAGQSLTLWGNVYPIPEGINLAQLMEDILIDAVELNWADARGGVDMWELHMPWGLKKCMMNTAACMRPCQTCGTTDPDSTRFEDEALRERFIRMMNGDVIELMPSMRTIVPLQSQRVEDNTMWLGPGSLGGRPSYVLFFDDIDRYINAFGDLANDGFNLFPRSEMNQWIAPDAVDGIITNPQLTQSIQDMAFYWYIAQKTIKCLEASMIACLGMLVCNRHLWYKITGVDCCSVVEPCDDHITDVTP